MFINTRLEASLSQRYFQTNLIQARDTIANQEKSHCGRAGSNESYRESDFSKNSLGTRKDKKFINFLKAIWMLLLINREVIELPINNIFSFEHVHDFVASCLSFVSYISLSFYRIRSSKIGFTLSLLVISRIRRSDG